MHLSIVGLELVDPNLLLVGLSDDISHEFLLLFVLGGEKNQIVS